LLTKFIANCPNVPGGTTGASFDYDSSYRLLALNLNTPADCNGPGNPAASSVTGLSYTYSGTVLTNGYQVSETGFGGMNSNCSGTTCLYTYTHAAGRVSQIDRVSSGHDLDTYVY